MRGRRRPEGSPFAIQSHRCRPRGGVHLSWKDNSRNQEGFEIDRKEGNAAFAELDTVPFDMAVYHDAAVSLGKKYTYRVRAKLATGYSGYSNEAAVDLGGGSGVSVGPACL